MSSKKKTPGKLKVGISGRKPTKVAPPSNPADGSFLKIRAVPGVAPEKVKKARVAAAADPMEIPPALAKRTPGYITKLEVIVRQRAGRSLTKLAATYPPKKCAVCTKMFRILDYIAERGTLHGRLPSRCRECSEQMGQPWLRWNDSYRPAKHQERAAERIRKARAAAETRTK